MQTTSKQKGLSWKARTQSLLGVSRGDTTPRSIGFRGFSWCLRFCRGHRKHRLLPGRHERMLLILRLLAVMFGLPVLGFRLRLVPLLRQLLQRPLVCWSLKHLLLATSLLASHVTKKQTSIIRCKNQGYWKQMTTLTMST